MIIALTANCRKRQRCEPVTTHSVHHSVRRDTKAKPDGVQHPGWHLGPEGVVRIVERDCLRLPQLVFYRVGVFTPVNFVY